MSRKNFNLKTKSGYDFFEVSSTLQKAIRRNDAKVAGIAALEMFPRYRKYIWKRLLTISAEDCYGMITREVESLYRSFQFINEGNSKWDKGRIFISKAVILLCESKKSRDADHLQNLVYDDIGMDDIDVQRYIADCQNEKLEIPEYAYDVHTRTGKMMGKTKTDFMVEEQQALEPRQLGLFDNYVSKLEKQYQ